MSYKKYLSKTCGQQQIKSNSYRTQLGFASIILCWLILLCAPLHAQTHNPQILQQCKTNITNQSIAKAIPNNSIDRPNQGWKPVQNFPDFVENHWENYKGNVWYKIHWTTNCDDPEEPLALVLSHINMAGKVYINDHLIWQDKSLIEPLSRSWNIPRIWSIPKSSIQNKDNIIWVYVSSAALQKTSLGHVDIGTYEQVLPLFQDYKLKQRTLLSIGFLINIIVGIFYFMVWVIYRKESAYLWISIAVLFWLFYSLYFILDTTPIASIQLERLAAWLFSTYTIVSFISIWRFANLKFPKIEQLLLYIFLIVSSVLIFIPNKYLELTIQLFFMLNMAVFLLGNLTYPFLTYKSKQFEIYLMAGLHVFFVPVAIHDAYQILTNQNEFWSPFISPFTALILGLLLGLRLYRNNKIIAQFNQTLTNEINSVTQKLSSSLNSQHQLALENIRLQERINLSHDLHDGIGGSIVRSIELVSRNEHLDKNNFLSILKLLSNDLRQIIDHGSSLYAQTPESPILWVASTRHRFMEIFDELNIDARWETPQEWINPPYPLQCLTLTRVLEEALTNIIKHSKATKVKISLRQTKQSTLLEIVDNGIGFKPETVEDTTHVGLHSMQMRVQRANGKFILKSSTQGTIIQITFNH